MVIIEEYFKPEDFPFYKTVIYYDNQYNAIKISKVKGYL